MSAHHNIIGPSALASSDSVGITAIGDAIKISAEDRDPQAVFYLNPLFTAQSGENSDSIEDVHVTQYLWAPKIEQTVQDSKLGKVAPKERHTIQLSWERASFRAKLVDYLTRTTPWLSVLSDSAFAPVTESLTNHYFQDKKIYQKLVHNYLTVKVAPIPQDRLKIIENYVVETLALAQGKGPTKQQFCVLSPSVEKAGPITYPVIQTITMIFQHSHDAEGKIELAFSGASYKAKINEARFRDQEIDKKMVALGMPLVKDWTLDVVM